MNTYSSLRKRNNGSLLAVVSLALCVVLTSTMLFSRLVTFVTPDTQHYIPLTRSGGITTVWVGQRQGDGSVVYEDGGYDPTNHKLLTASPNFRVYDENTVWSSQTDIEIFKISYENGSGQVTVNSQRGDKVLAPGTENTYRFTLENTGNVSVDYELTMEAYFSHTDTPIPIQARVTDYQGNYLAGSAEGKADVLELNNVHQTGTLARRYVAPYTLEWEWPFELDDEYDTMLGNLAVDEDITLTIVIKTIATCNPDPVAPGGNPKTGDDMPIGLLMCVMAGSAMGLVILLLPRKKREEEA
ncbi:MAG: hypothetical protein IJB59_06705 [Oscillospiraceae bacterium]|nr:hypothetical protein [Oscillospiraceae bacterium]